MRIFSLEILAAAVLVAVTFLASPTAAVHSIDDYGAVRFPNKTDAAAMVNVQAIQNALLAANASTTDRTVVVPSGASYWIKMAVATELKDVTLRVEGTLTVSNDIKMWPNVKHTPEGYPLSVLYFELCDGLTIEGPGEIDGLGYDWWWANILEGRDRPHMIYVKQSSNIILRTITLFDSPMYHVRLQDVAHVHCYNMSIIVHIDDQKKLLKKAGRWHPSIDIPVFPLNTDGIDPSGRDILIEDVFIQNFDDAVAVKPSNANDKMSPCAQDMVIRNCVVKNGVGMTIGSVPPAEGTNCVKNVTFQNITFLDPFKAVYIKSNPGDTGDAVIEDILYENLIIKNSLWYPVWIGPQQQDQPSGGANTGCNFLYPVFKACPTQPRIAMNNITIRNSVATGGLWLPGVVLCDPHAVCKNIVFDNFVSTGKFEVQKNYACHNAEVSSLGTTSPVAQCSLPSGDRSWKMD